jgi:hypothetical protein
MTGNSPCCGSKKKRKIGVPLLPEIIWLEISHVVVPEKKVSSVIKIPIKFVEP